MELKAKHTLDPNMHIPFLIDKSVANNNDHSGPMHCTNCIVFADVLTVPKRPIIES